MATALAEPPSVRGKFLVKRSSPAQKAFWDSKSRYKLFCGGIGAGKTLAGTAWAYALPPNTTCIIAAPTYKILESATVDMFLRIGRAHNQIAEYNVVKGLVRLRDGKRFFFRSAERAENLRGPNANAFWFDEAALMKDRRAYDILLGRCRLAPRVGAVTTTPNGLNWLYDEYVTDKGAEQEVFTAATSSNPSLDQGFYESMKGRYASDFALQELEGQFLDLSGSFLFDANKLETVSTIPPDLPSCRWWDPAVTAGGGDYTAGVKICGPDETGTYYVADVIRGQWEPAERDRIVRAAAVADGVETRIGVPQERGAGGAAQPFYFARFLAGYSLTWKLENRHVAERANPWATQVNTGHVRLLSAPWNREFQQEHRSFPGGRNDDQVVAALNAFDELSRGDDLGVTL